MKNKLVLILAVVAGLSVVAYADPVEWGGHYYELVGSSGTWDEAKTAAEGLSYNGYIGHLATLNSEAEYNFIRTLPGFSDWHISWVGGYKSGSEWVWVNEEGFMDFAGWSQSPWQSGEPESGDYGVSLVGTGHGGGIRGDTVAGTDGEYVVEYQAVPEPATAMILGLGGALIALYRRFFGRV